MQTFLPSPSYTESARVLDDARLGKQRVEAYQVIRTLDGVTKGWQHHPCVKMWRGHETALLEYSTVVCEEWIRRGHLDTVLEKLQVHARPDPAVPPPWLGDERLHASHRSNLLRKDAEFYGRFGWTEPPDLPYWWPV
ncbi:MAG: MSMEG_6728 family protein [Jatrophihabitans sp.]|uniref:MSMEG_6728 family protein n=1 Tax=Jatrophihabitans sp. TaxID=1932789 RepID=UPI003F81AD1C